jgi:hypothetical protein
LNPLSRGEEEEKEEERRRRDYSFNDSLDLQ